jgi:hypothetical protein
MKKGLDFTVTEIIGLENRTSCVSAMVLTYNQFAGMETPRPWSDKQSHVLLNRH